MSKNERQNITHKNLKEAIKEIKKDESQMVIVLKTDTDKPDIYHHKELDGKEYETSTDKMGYIHNLTELQREDIILPITQEVIAKVESNIGSKAMAKVEKELYDIVLEANK